MRQILFVTLLLMILSVTGCAPTPKTLGRAANPYPLTEKPVPDTLVHLPTGTIVSTEQMLADISSDRIIYAGETHDNPASHRFQLTILNHLIQRYPQHVAVGMEMFHHDQQPVLDRWIAGELDEKSFLRQLHWYESWGIDYAYYRDLLTTMREHHIPIIALNVSPKQKMAVMQGKETTPEVNDPYYHATLMAYFAGHDHGNGEAEAFIRIQNLWDNTMAQTVVDYLSQPEHTHDHLLVLAGGNHVRNGFGIPRRVYQKLPLSYSLVGNDEVEIDDSKQDRFMQVTLPELPLLPYDYLLYNRYEAGPQHMRLGVLLEQQDDGVVIGKVMPGSLAESSEIKAQDRIVSLNGEAVKEPFDVIYALRQQQPGDTVTLIVERQAESIEVRVTFAQ